MNTTTDHSRQALLSILDTAPKDMFHGWGRPRRLLIGGGVLLLIAVLATLGSGGETPAGTYVTEDAVTGNLMVSVSANGTLQPTKSVDVGSEQSGTLASVLG